MSNEDQLEWLEQIACDKMIEYIKGDLFETECEYIAHGVNCQGVMGSGVAKIVRDRFPQSYNAYLMYCNHNWYPDHDKGDFDKSVVLGNIYICQKENDKFVIHCFTQLNYGKTKQRYIDYEAVYKVFKKLSRALSIKGIEELAMPKIGAGLGGGEWSIIEVMIKATLCAAGIKVRVYSLD